MAIIPKITVTQVDNVPKGAPGIAGKVAVVAEFSKTLTAPISVKSYAEAIREAVTLPITNSSPVGDQILDSLFRGGATDVIIKDISPSTAGSPTGAEIVTAATTLEEKYDILFIPYVLTDSNITAVKAYIDDRFEASHPVGLIAPITRTAATDYVTTAALFADGGTFGLVSQQFTVNDTVLSVAQSAAYYCGLVSERKVDASFTMKTLEGVEAVTTEMTFAAGDNGYKLVEAGYPIAKCLNRAEKNFVIVNSRLPHVATATDGTQLHLDLYMERTINYIINLFNLEDYFGEKNNQITLDAIEQRLARIKHDVVDIQGLVNDIVYSVEKVNRDCVRTNIEEIVFDGVITEIDANVTYDVI
ncbi:MAG: hypothetical protein J6T31_06045 [Methanobrevibacter sp.]|nr:hypothetical protein [Methanobrevibacter sp.]